MKPLVSALHRQPLDRPPVWIMRQAGRHLPEYRKLRERYSFQEAVSTPAVSAELTLQPIHRYGMDGAVIFADIMTPLEVMGVDMSFDPGPKLRPHTLGEVADLPALDVDGIGFIAETIGRVASEVPDHVAVIGFAGAPLTLLAYLVEGGGSKDFMTLRGALRADPAAGRAALTNLATAMHTYLAVQIEAGADAVQLFDTWANVLSRDTYHDWAGEPARRTLAGLNAPSIYFAPGSSHTLDQHRETGATAYGVDWRIELDRAWDTLGDVAVQGNLDPALLLTDPETIAEHTASLLDSVAGRRGHILNLGHGIDRMTPPEHVAAFVAAARR